MVNLNLIMRYHLFRYVYSILSRNIIREKWVESLIHAVQGSKRLHEICCLGLNCLNFKSDSPRTLNPIILRL